MFFFLIVMQNISTVLTLGVQPINEITIQSSSSILNIQENTPFTIIKTYALTTNGDNKKIIASLGSPLCPSGEPA